MENNQSGFEVAFMGEIQPANCECHKGKFFCVVYVVHGSKPPQHVANIAFDTSEECEREMPNVMKKVAEEILGAAGLKPENANAFTRGFGDDAEKLLKDFQARQRSSNPNLH